jgi:hypothetical protein
VNVLLHPSRVVYNGSFEERGLLVPFTEPESDITRKCTLATSIFLLLLGLSCIARIAMWGIAITTQVNGGPFGCWSVDEDKLKIAGYVGYAHAALYLITAFTTSILIRVKLGGGELLLRYWVYFFKRNWSVWLWIVFAGACSCITDLLNIVDWGTLFIAMPLLFSSVDIAAFLVARHRILHLCIRFSFLMLFLDLLGGLWAFVAVSSRCGSVPESSTRLAKGVVLFVGHHLSKLTYAAVVVTYGHLLLRKVVRPKFPAINYSFRHRFVGPDASTEIDAHID